MLTCADGCSHPSSPHQASATTTSTTREAAVCYPPQLKESTTNAAVANFRSLNGYSWRITYGDQSGASGSVGTDTVAVGNTVVRGQAVELASQVSAQFVQDTSDGLLGLAFSNINTVQPRQQKTFFDNAKSSLASPLFAAYLPYHKNGAYDFGYLDTSKYTGQIQYADVDSSGGFWQFTSNNYKVNGQEFNSDGTNGIADTGTTLVLMNDDAVNNYYNAVNGANYNSQVGGYTFPCNTALPTLSFQIGDAFADVPGNLLNFGDAGAGDGTCFGALQSVGQAAQQNIYGDVFFNAYYGIFDSRGPRFGFAKAT